MRSAHSAVLGISLLGVLFGCLAHLLSYFGYFLDTHLLYFKSAFAIVILMIIVNKKASGFGASEILGRIMSFKWTRDVPFGVLLSFVLIMIYNMVVANLRIPTFGLPVILDDKFYMQLDGQLVKSISLGEYQHLMGNKVRADSAVPHMVFTLAFMILYLSKKLGKV